MNLRLQIMRTCMSFLIVEYMRMGVPVGEACRKGIERLLALTPLYQLKQGVGTSTQWFPSGGAAPQHPMLAVGVVAMDANGNVRAIHMFDCLYCVRFCSIVSTHPQTNAKGFTH